MALFGRKKKEDTTAVVEAPAKASSAQSTPGSNVGSDMGRILRNPRITEKATSVQTVGVYTFDIAKNVSKRQIIEAVRFLYKVTPRKVAVVAVPTKTRRSTKTGKLGITRGGKKAYVYLKTGETITIH